jgi:hypothetical protein
VGIAFQRYPLDLVFTLGKKRVQFYVKNLYLFIRILGQGITFLFFYYTGFQGTSFHNFEISQLSLGGSYKSVTTIFFKSQNQSFKKF